MLTVQEVAPTVEEVVLTVEEVALTVEEVVPTVEAADVAAQRAADPDVPGIIGSGGREAVALAAEREVELAPRAYAVETMALAVEAGASAEQSEPDDEASEVVEVALEGETIELQVEIESEMSDPVEPTVPKADGERVEAAQPDQSGPVLSPAPDDSNEEPETASESAREPIVLAVADEQPAEALAADQESPSDPAAPRASEELMAIVEALIFASPDPLTPKAIFKVLDSEPKEDVQSAIDALVLDYQGRRGGLQLIELAGGFQIVTRQELSEWVRRLFHERKTARLSVQALETLAVIAYKQPVTSAEIAEIRGVNTAGVLSTLVERKLIKTAGRKPVVGRPFLYATTREFLIRFGLNDLADLPKVEEMAEALGFDLPSALETGPAEQLLPLGEFEALPDDPQAPSSESEDLPGDPASSPEPEPVQDDPDSGPETVN